MGAKKAGNLDDGAIQSAAMRSAILFFPAVLTLACGSDEVPPKEVPSPAQVRSYFGINTDSCFRYAYSAGGATVYARISYTGPNMTSIAGKTVFVRAYSKESGGLPEEWFLNTESNGQVRLLRSTEGQGGSRITRRYETEPQPLFAELVFDKMNQPGVAVGDRFEVEATPKACIGNGDCTDAPTEKHTWTVLALDRMVTTPEGQVPAVELEYRVQAGADAPRVSTYSLVPGKGIAKFTDFTGTLHQVCAWRTCDAAGACTGAASCNDLICN